MAGVFLGLDKAVQDHLRYILEYTGLSAGEESLEILAEGWREKEKAFDEQIQTLGMVSAESSEDINRGFLALTHSGSLVAVGPVETGKRNAVYVSIDRRKDVPSRAESQDAVLAHSVEKGKEVVFKKGPVKQSSAVYRLALLPEALALEDQRERLEEATLALTREFKALDDTIIDKD